MIHVETVFFFYFLKMIMIIYDNEKTHCALMRSYNLLDRTILHNNFPESLQYV